MQLYTESGLVYEGWDVKQPYCPVGMDPLEWCVLPQLDLPRFWSKPTAPKALLTELRSVPKLFGAEVSGGLVIWGTQNGKRTFAPLVDVPDYREVTLKSGRIDWARSAMSSHSRSRLARIGREVLEANDLLDLLPVWDFLLKHTQYCLRMANKLKLDQYRFVGVASQHAAYSRAFIWEAARLGVPTIYVPHAPIGANAQYMDLPTSAVALRGVGEVDLYADVLGVDTQRMNVIGNPSSDVLAELPPPIDANALGVLALSPQPTEVLEQLIRAVDESGLTNLRVAPHPRSDVERLKKMVPPGWVVEEGRRTLDMLREGPPFLLQHSSGVAWEAIALGIPTLQISLDGAVPNYYFLRDEVIFPRADASDPASIARFVAALDHSVAHRDQLRTYARRWCECDGEEAGEKLRRLLATCDRWPSSMVFDGWGTGPNATTNMSHLL